MTQKPAVLVKFACFIFILTSSLASSGEVTPALPQGDTEWDWIKLDTGELLKGEIIAMYEDKLEFDSDHFGRITIDWDDVVEIETIRRQAIRTQQREVLTGKVSMANKEVTITLGTAERTIRKNEVVSMATGQQREIHKWSAKVSAGGTFRSGNVEQTDFNLRATVQRRTANTRLYWDYTGNLSRSMKIETENNHRSNAYFDYYLRKRLFLRPITVEYYRDVFSNLDHRYTLGAAVGYTLVDAKNLEIDFTAGPSWQTSKFLKVGPDESKSEESFGALTTLTIDWDLTNRIEFIGTYRGQFANKESGGISTHSDSTLEIEITDDIDLTISYIWDFTSEPVVGGDGKVPGKSDTWLVFGLGIDL